MTVQDAYTWSFQILDFQRELEGTAGVVYQDEFQLDLRNKIITRDANGCVASVEYDGVDTWTVTRNADGTVASVQNATYTKTVDRDADGVVTGITVTGASAPVVSEALLMEDGSILITESGDTLVME